MWILNRISRSITWSLFILKASYLVKWPISTWRFMWWCQFIYSFLLNFETANLNNKNVNALIARELSGFTSTRSLIFNTALSGLLRYWNFSFIVSELVQVNPDNLILSLSALTFYVLECTLMFISWPSWQSYSLHQETAKIFFLIEIKLESSIYRAQQNWRKSKFKIGTNENNYPLLVLNSLKQK